MTFFPWVNPAYSDEEKDQDLMQIIRNALELTMWLYSQPFLYEFVWENIDRRGTTVAPGLARITDDRGQTCERADMLLEPIVISA